MEIWKAALILIFVAIASTVMCKAVFAQTETITVRIRIHTDPAQFCMSEEEMHDTEIDSLFWHVRRCCMFVNENRPLPESCLVPDITERFACCDAYDGEE